MRKPRNYWTKEKCVKEAQKYKYRVKFQKGSKGAYLKAFRNKWLNEICIHMKEIKKPNGYWNNKETCKTEALNHKTISSFMRSSAYKYSKENGWITEFFI